MDSTPSNEDQEWLDKQSRYIGFRKPDVRHVKEESRSYSFEDEARCAEGDYLRMDDQGFDNYKE